jgi:flagellar protein FlaG
MDIATTTMPAPPGGIERGGPDSAGPATGHQGGAVPAAETAGPHTTRLELDIDEATDRVIGRIVDTVTGDVIQQVPREEVVRLIARARELIGRLFDETV